MVGERRLAKRDAWFIRFGKKDPLTGEQFKLGDTIVVCAECKAPHLKASWELLGHCSVRPDHKHTAASFNPRLFERKTYSSKFNIKDKIEFKPGEKLKWIDWYKPAATVTFILTAVMLILTVAIGENRSIAAASIKSLPSEIGVKMVHVGFLAVSNLNDDALEVGRAGLLPFLLLAKDGIN